MEVQKGDVISIQVVARNSIIGSDTVYADVTFVSENGRVYFKPRANLKFLRGNVEQRIYAGQVYSTDDFHLGIFTGSWRNILSLKLCTTTMKVEDMPSHDYGASRFTTKEDSNGASSVDDRVGEFFKSFTSRVHHHHYIMPQKKFDSMLTEKCEDAKKMAEGLQEAVSIAHCVVNRNDFEYTIRMMMKAGFTPHQIAEEIQRQFYNAMVKE